MKITNEMIAAAELKLAEVLSMWHYEMPRDGMEQVLSAALQSVVTEEMVENACRAAYPGWDEIIKEAERVWKRKQMHSAISAALQSAADTPAPQEHLAGTPEVEHMRQKAISNARERNAALRAIQAALDDFELIVDRINAGQINRACATAMQGAKEAKLALAASAPEDALSPFKAKEE